MERWTSRVRAWEGDSLVPGLFSAWVQGWWGGGGEVDSSRGLGMKVHWESAV